jgi:hypothetical protein
MIFKLDIDPQLTIWVDRYYKYNQYTCLSAQIIGMPEGKAILVFKELLDKISWVVLCDSILVIFDRELVYNAVRVHVDAGAIRNDNTSLVHIRSKLSPFLGCILCEMLGSDITGIILLIYIKLLWG